MDRDSGGPAVLAQHAQGHAVKDVELLKGIRPTINEHVTFLPMFKNKCS